MALREGLLAEFDMEMATTRAFLERVPADKLAYTPHAKSMPMGDLAVHLAWLPFFLTTTLTTDELDMAGMEHMQRPDPLTPASILALFDANAAKARETLAAVEDATLFNTWSLRAGDKVYFTLPRIAVLRSFTFSHIIHHRAQLGVYLRMNDVALPSSYGPTADVGM